MTHAFSASRQQRDQRVLPNQNKNLGLQLHLVVASRNQPVVIINNVCMFLYEFSFAWLLKHTTKESIGVMKIASFNGSSSTHHYVQRFNLVV